MVDETVQMFLDENKKWFVKRTYHAPMLELGYKSDEHFREPSKPEIAELMNTNPAFKRWYKFFTIDGGRI